MYHNVGCGPRVRVKDMSQSNVCSDFYCLLPHIKRADRSCLTTCHFRNVSCDRAKIRVVSSLATFEPMEDPMSKFEVVSPLATRASLIERSSSQIEKIEVVSSLATFNEVIKDPNPKKQCNVEPFKNWSCLTTCHGNEGQSCLTTCHTNPKPCHYTTFVDSK